MMRITKGEAMDYVTSLPSHNQIKSDGYWIRGFAFVMTAVACCTLGTINIAFAFACAAVFEIALITGCKFIMNKCKITHYALLSDSFVFLSCSVSLAMITAYIIYKINGNLAIGFAVTVLINAIDIFFVAVYARTMIKRRLYKQEKNGGANAAALLGLGGAGLGWALAKHLFAGAAGDQQLSVLATITLLLGLLFNFGLAGFVKYHCYRIIEQTERESGRNA